MTSQPCFSIGQVNNKIKDKQIEVKFNYQWTIKETNFTNPSLGTRLISPDFSVEIFNKKFIWHLKAYPVGENSENENILSVYLELVSCDEREVQANVKFSIFEGSKESYKQYGEHRFIQDDKNKNYWGLKKYITKDNILNRRRLIFNNGLTINCEIRMQLSFPEYKLSNELGMLLENKKFSDVTFSVAGSEFQAHKAILAARSPVFAAMFEHKMKEKEISKVDITDVDLEVIKEMIEFIYTGKVDNLGNIADMLLVAADKYKLGELKVLCEEVLCNNLAVDNAVDYLIYADMHSAELLKKQAINFINNHAEYVMDTTGMQALFQYQHLFMEVYLTATQQIKQQTY